MQPISSLASFFSRENKNTNLLNFINTDSYKNEHAVSVMNRFCFTTSRLGENLCSVCGGCTVSQVAISQMGNYAITLARKEIDREATSDRLHDEDTPYGILRRKLDINFGSPYKKIGRKGMCVASKMFLITCTTSCRKNFACEINRKMYAASNKIIT